MLKAIPRPSLLRTRTSRASFQSRLGGTHDREGGNFQILFYCNSAPRRSSAGFARHLFPAAAAAALAALSVYAAVTIAASPDISPFNKHPFDHHHQIPVLPAVPLLTGSITTPTTMSSPTTTSVIAPGRPETLTKEEEAKLKQFWHAALTVFGVSASATAVVDAGTSTSTGPPPSSAATQDDADEGSPDGKRKKKSLGRLLSRRNRTTEPSPGGAATDSSTVSDASDDKYGQTKEFKAALASQTPAELRVAFWSMVKCDNPDGLLLRFLRARKWDVDKALVMMVATMNWRSKEMDVQALVEKGEEGAAMEKDNDFMMQLRMGKSYLHGLDKDGRPICFVRVRLHKQGEQSEESLERYTVYIMETARLMIQPPVDTAAVIFDMTGFSLANMDYAPVKYLIRCFEAHYPESLGICLVHKAPWIFSSFWAVIKGWLDPVVASKIHFTKTTQEMEQFIPREHIPKDLGGAEDWTYTYVEPLPGENAPLLDVARRQSLQSVRDEQVREFEALTRNWIAAGGDDEGGSGNGVAAQRRKEIARKLSEGYWEMDRYLRARTIYDRTGVLKPNGAVDFYHNQEKNGVAETSMDDID